MKSLNLILLLSFVGLIQAQRFVQFTNKCPHDIWIEPLTNAQGPAHPDGIVRLGNQATHTYHISQEGWGGRFWPKQGCDGNGHNCEVGQSMPPCLPGGCDPPAETKVEFFFPHASDPADIWYDVSLVDGFSLPADIIPSQTGGSCRETHCSIPLDECPQDEADVGDLRVFKNGRVVACLAPCKKWNYPPPFGIGQSEHIQPGLHLCCPTPPIYPEECRAGLVVRTKYVDLVHRTCPTAYSYSYDDEAGLHNCPNGINFHVTICP